VWDVPAQIGLTVSPTGWHPTIMRYLLHEFQQRARSTALALAPRCTALLRKVYFPYPGGAKPFLPGEAFGGGVSTIEYSSTKDCRCRLSCKPFPHFYGISVSAPASHVSRRPNMTSVAAHPPETNGGIVTSWLPLTSAWPSVAECATGGIYSQIGANGALAIAYDPYYGMSIDRSLTCLPPFATAWWSQTTTTPLLTHTSLGPFVCPGGYTTATSSVVDDISTFVGCCPS
jgi:hypothetical protein